jgi:uncharacterized protein DUF6602
MNRLIEQRLVGIQLVLSSAFEAGKLMSPASKGSEREIFISYFLTEVLPPIYRFGSGDITDAAANTAGQMDLVIEVPWCPSFPVGGAGVRLYPAEGVGAAIEVKSDLAKEWGDVQRKAEALSKLRQRLAGVSVDDEGKLMLHVPTDELIPFYAVGYEGWKTTDSISPRLRGAQLDGILVIKHQVFAWSNRKEYLSRTAEWKAQLEKERSKEPFRVNAITTTHAACGRLLGLQEQFTDPTEIAAEMNREATTVYRSVSPMVLFVGGKPLPHVEPGKWNAENVQEVLQSMSMKVEEAKGASALLQFISVIYGEVAKRAAMVTNLLRYS